MKSRQSRQDHPMTVSYEHVRIAPKSEFIEQLIDKSFQEMMENCCGNAEADSPKIIVSQPQIDTIQSILGDADCESVGKLQGFGLSNNPAATIFLSTSGPALVIAESHIGLGSFA